MEHPKKAFGWAARDSSGLLFPFHFSRRETILCLHTVAGVLMMAQSHMEATLTAWLHTSTSWSASLTPCHLMRLPLAILCAGITVYSPLRKESGRWQLHWRDEGNTGNA